MDRDQLSLEVAGMLLARYCPDCPGAAVVDADLAIHLVRAPSERAQPAGASPRASAAAEVASSCGTLRDAISRVKQERAPVTLYGVEVGEHGRARTCDVVVMPFGAAPELGEHFLVLFEEPRAHRTDPVSRQAIARWIGGQEAESQQRRPHPLDLPGRTRDYAQLRGLRILILDDDLPTLDAIVEVLRISGANVRGETSSADGTRALDQFAPQVVISDIAMPGEDGYSFVRGLRARDAAHGGKIPALALTALDSEEDRRRALAAGYQMHMSKPVDIDRLRDAVVELLGLQVGGSFQ